MKYALIAASLIVFGIGAALVYAESNSARAIATCQKETQNFKAICYTDRVNEILSKRGLPSALKFIAAAYVADPYVASFCHSNMHDLGKAAYQAFASTGSIDLTTDASYCGFGFYHGFMEEMLLETGSLAQAKAFCAAVGKKLGGDQAYAEGSCYHGIGHGVTDGTDVSLRGDAGALAAPGLALCRTVSPGGEFAMRCASGVFNSVALMYRDAAYKLNAHDDPYALCRTTSYSADERHACYEQMNTLVAYISEYDPFREIEYALSVEPVYRDLAVRSAMAVVYSRSTRRDPSQAPTICARAPESSRPACIRGLVDGLIEFGTPGTEMRDALEFCEASGWSQDEARICMREIVAYAPGLYTAAVQARICDAIPTALRPDTCEAITVAL